MAPRSAPNAPRAAWARRLVSAVVFGGLALVAGLVLAGSGSAAAFAATTTTQPTITSGPSDPTTDPALSWAFTLTDPTAGACELSLDGSVVSALADCTSPFGWDATGAPGTYTFTVYDAAAANVDPATTASATASATYTAATSTGPAAPVVTATPTVGSTPTATYTVQAAPGLKLACVVSGPAAFTGTGPVKCKPTVKVDLTGAPDGDYTLTVTATDSSGGTATGSATYTFDTTPPAAPTLSAPASPANDRTPTFGISAEPGATLTCTLTGPAGTVSGPAACPADGTFDLTGAPDGQYTLTATATDAAGNTSPEATAGYLLDTTAPAAPTVAPPASPGNGRTPTFGISAEPGAALTCTLTGPAGTVSGPAACPADGTFDLTGAPDGTYTVSVTATDAAGNTSQPASASYTLDTVPPAAPSVTVPTSPSNLVTPVVTVTVDPDSTATCTLTGPDGAVFGPATCPADGTFDLTGAPDGDYTVTVVATDAAGNASAATSATWTLDTTPPPAPTVTGSGSPSASRTLSATVTGEPKAVLTCTLLGPSGATVAGPTTCSGAVTYTLSAGDGGYALVVVATDPAGNVSPETRFGYVLDTVAPAQPVVVAPASPGNDRQPTFSVSAEPGAALVCTLTRSYATVTGPAACPAGGGFDLTGSPDGTYVLTVVAVDAAGNTSAPATATYVLDTTAPGPPVLTEPGSPSSNESPTWTFTTEPDTTATCTLVGPGGQGVFGPAPCTSPATFSLGGLADGGYTLQVVLVDAAGNVGPAVTSAYTLDRTAPMAPVLTPPATPGNDRTPTWGIAVAPGMSATCTLSAGTTRVFGPATCPRNGTFSLSGRPDGGYTLSVVAVDAAGNRSAVSRSTYVLDTHPPATPAPSYGTASPSAETQPFWAFTVEKGADAWCSLYRGRRVVVAAYRCHDAVTFDLTRLVDGTLTVRIVAVDAAGNRSRPLDISYRLDRSLPSGLRVAAPSGRTAHPTWYIEGPVGTTFVCTLDGPRGRVAGPAGCGSSYTADLTRQPYGTYTLGVTGRTTDGRWLGPVDAAFAYRAPVAGAAATTRPRPRPAAVVHRPPLPPPAPPVAHVPVAAAPPPAHVRPRPTSTPHRDPHPVTLPVPLPGPVRDVVQGVVSAVSHTRDKGTFPLALLLVVVVFLVVQGRIDRRDPKLALAAVSAEDDLEFNAAPSLGAPRT